MSEDGELQPDIGRMESTTWGGVMVGHIVRDQRDRLHTVVVAGPAIVEMIDAQGSRASIRRPLPERPVDIYVPSETERLQLLHQELGARILRDIEEREHTVARTLTWRLDPIARRLVVLRDHLDWMHGVNVDDVLRKGTGTKINPADAKAKKVSVEELCRLHDETHERPDLWPHSFVHYHAKIGD